MKLDPVRASGSVFALFAQYSTTLHLLGQGLQGLLTFGIPAPGASRGRVTAAPVVDAAVESNNLARMYDVTDTFQVGNPLSTTATIDLRVRRIDLPSDWAVVVSPLSVTLAPGEQTTATVTVHPGSNAVQGTLHQVAIEGYVGSTLISGVSLDLLVPKGQPFGGLAVNVGNKVRVTYTGYVLNRATNTFDTVATITNTSTDILDTPVSLIVTSITPASVTLANAAGTTAEGKPFVDVAVPQGGLPPGGTVSNILLKFSNPTRVRFTFSRSVLGVISDPPPTVSITSPAEAATLIEGSTITISADATDNVRVESVRFTLNGMSLPLIATPPFSAQFTIPVGIRTLAVEATATDNLGQTKTATRTVNVIPDPGTTAAGRIVDSEGNPVQGATVTCLGISGLTGPDGTFSLTGLPTIRGDIRCTATFITPEGGTASVSSAAVSPVPGGQTPLGAIEIHVIVVDDFSRNILDRTRWADLEFVRRVNNGKLESALRRSGQNGSNNVNFVNPASVSALQADVTVTEVSNTEARPVARLVGSFYNDGTPGSGFVGDVIGAVEISHNGTELVGSFGASRCTRPACNVPGEFTTLVFDNTTFGPVALGVPHTLSLTWDGSQFTFGFDGRTVTFDPRAAAPVAGPPRTAFKAIGTRVSGIDGPDKGGFIGATFDNVLIAPPIAR